MSEIASGTERESATAAVDRCFLCGEPFRPERGEPVEAGEGLFLCLPCGAFYRLPGGCC